VDGGKPSIGQEGSVVSARLIFNSVAIGVFFFISCNHNL